MFQFDAEGAFDRGATAILVCAHEVGDVVLVVARPKIFGAAGKLMLGLDTYEYAVVDGKATLAQPLQRAFGAGSIVSLLEVTS